MGVLPQRQFSPNSPNESPLPGLQFFTACPSSTGCNPSGTGCSRGTSPARNLLLWGLHTAFFKHPSLPWGLLHGLQVEFLHGLQGHRCLTMAFTTGCQRISAPASAAPSPPPPSPPLVPAGLFLSLLSPDAFFSGFFSPFLTLIPEALPPVLMALAWSHLGLGHGGSFWKLLPEATLQPNP